jgi:hypothetical protein
MRFVLTLMSFYLILASRAWAATNSPPTHDTEQLVVGAAVLIAVAAIAIILGRYTDILRDAEPVSFGSAADVANYRRPYSLAQSQMTWWFCLIVASYVYIAIATGAINEILTPQSLILIGIGTGTALGASIIEQSKDKDPKIVQLTALTNQINALGLAATPDLKSAQKVLADQLKSEGFFRDVLSDVDGISLHRFQAVVWTVVLGAFFVVNVVTQLKMPVFDNLLLGALGISGATYLGFKIPEQSS